MPGKKRFLSESSSDEENAQAPILRRVARRPAFFGEQTTSATDDPIESEQVETVTFDENSNVVIDPTLSLAESAAKSKEALNQMLLKGARKVAL